MTTPGRPVLGAAEPSRNRRPMRKPRLVSTTRCTSSPAVKPGPTPMTRGASARVTPIFVLAIVASTTTSGRMSVTQRPAGSTRTGTAPRAQIDAKSAGVSARRAVTPSTVIRPSYRASEKLTVRRTAIGWGISRKIRRRSPAPYRRRAAPVATSPAPRNRMTVCARSGMRTGLLHGRSGAAPWRRGKRPT